MCSDICFWFKVDKELLGYEFILGAIYVPHEASVYFDQDCFDDLSSDLITLSSKQDIPICIAGDFNARTGKLNDFLVSDDDKFDNSFHMHLKESIDMLNDLNIPLRRTNMDSKINNNGYKLLELCINFDLRILNGRVGQDINKGKFTCVSESGNSVIDYIIYVFMFSTESYRFLC